MKNNQRLVALDVMRGLTIAGMILVNTPGTWSYVYAPLQHARWNGLTPTDVIFPFFLFMMGVSMYISLKKCSFHLSSHLLMKIIRRSLILFLIGTAIYALATFLGTLRDACRQPGLEGNPWKEAFASLPGTRIPGVLQRLGVCYGIGSIIVLTCRHRYIPHLAGGILAGHFLILLFGNGFVHSPENILSVVDRTLFGDNMINDGGIDPEGALSTLPSIAQVLIGFCIGKICIETPDMREKLNKIFLYGSLMLIVGWLFSYGCPLNKRVWTPSFVLVTCGFACLLLGILIWYIDLRKVYKQTWTFEVFGVNPLFCYVLSEVLAILVDYLPLHSATLHERFYSGFLSNCFGDNEWTSFLYAFSLLCSVWLIGVLLYKKKIYIKI